MNSLQEHMEDCFTAVAYADAGQPGWVEDVWSVDGKHASTPLARLLLFGCGSVLIYVLAFSHATAFASLCARGGWWSVLPIVSVLVLSYVHGSFAAALWELCGITGVRKQEAAAPQAAEATNRRGTASRRPVRLDVAAAHS
ncbi:hypothetical protein [Desulfovibrio legallii]|uniref:Uncharacterized protein n=1 Tax=Desulfovibrio legallii TaxID=571438 RepID=A0A6H3FFR5_9BACT|nr:hypothetical protein [Desulfovibrio legallii]RHH18681.1 hypothetical protein DW219_11425 [Desulfovibrio sp. AM18-2]TBH81428.1 hypothetical protein EB812_01300 [Desulfovibrio legallii]